MRHRSTIAGLDDRHCPGAAVHHHIGTPRDRTVFDTGIVTHALIEAAYLDQSISPPEAIESAIPAIIGEGVRFEGELRGPYPPEKVFIARDLALRWLDIEPPVERAHVEGGLAVDEHWALVEYPVKGSKSKPHWSGILDLVELYEEMDDDAGEIVHVLRMSDWKTDWPAREDRLDSLQFKGNACLTLAKYPKVDILILRVVNLQLPWAWERRYDLRDFEVQDQVEDWRRQIALTVAGLDRLGEDPEAVARPGVGCFRGEGGCPYRAHCKAADRAYGSETAEDLAIAWCSAKALVECTEPLLKATACDAPVPAGDGAVGFFTKRRRQPSENAWAVLAKAWGEIGGDLGGLLKTIRPGVLQLERAVRAMRKGRPHLKEEWDRVEDLLIQAGGVSEFGALPEGYQPDPPRDMIAELKAAVAAEKEKRS